jgi:hypothetical protein
MGSWHTEQTNFSPSVNESEGAVTAISVSTVRSFLTVDGLDRFFEGLAIFTRKDLW